ncbi:MAG: type II toxin-antitoxin system VapC family toxin [Nitrososphaerales archaeon]
MILESKVIDINILAIFLVRDHPAHQYVKHIMIQGLKGFFRPLIFDILPIRAYWLMTTKWKIDKHESSKVIRSFLIKYKQPVYVGINRETIDHAFQLAQELRHDVYDCCYLALAKQEGASSIITTDSDFGYLCNKQNLGYENPVPKSVIRDFKR